MLPRDSTSGGSQPPSWEQGLTDPSGVCSPPLRSLRPTYTGTPPLRRLCLDTARTATRPETGTVDPTAVTSPRLPGCPTPSSLTPHLRLLVVTGVSSGEEQRAFWKAGLWMIPTGSCLDLSCS